MTCSGAFGTSVSRSTRWIRWLRNSTQPGVEFHLRPIDAEGDVRIAFFFDPDGTLLELVERDLKYHEVHEPEGVARERALGVPARPRFDHVAVTAAEAAAIRERYRSVRVRAHRIDSPGGRSARIRDRLPEGRGHGSRGVHVHGPDIARAPQQTAPGFAAVTLGSGRRVRRSISAIGEDQVGVASDGRILYADHDGLVFAVAA